MNVKNNWKYRTFLWHLEIKPLGSIGLCSIEYKEDVYAKETELQKFCKNVYYLKMFKNLIYRVFFKYWIIKDEMSIGAVSFEYVETYSIIWDIDFSLFLSKVQVTYNSWLIKRNKLNL